MLPPYGGRYLPAEFKITVEPYLDSQKGQIKGITKWLRDGELWKNPRKGLIEIQTLF